MGGFGDTIVALSSGRPPAAISIIRSSGPAARSAAIALAGKLPNPRQAALRQFADPASGEVIDEGLFLFFPGPHSATGEDLVEYQCHGGRAVVEALLGALTAQPGVRLAEPGEFTRRALANGRLDLTEAEGLADLLAAETELQRKSAMLRANGTLRREIEAFRDRILTLSARAEVAIDYADEEDGAAADASLSSDIQQLAQTMALLASAPRVEPLRDGVRVVVAGPPNAGKSSLINALSKSDRAIVTDIAGTTRDVIEVPLAIAGVPFLLVDTAGLRDSEDVVEAIGVQRAHDQVGGADILLWMGEAGQAPQGDHVILLSPKSDLAIRPSGSGLPVSVVSGAGLAELTDRLLSLSKSLLPGDRQIALDHRQRSLLEQAVDALGRAHQLREPVFVAEELRVARAALDGISGRAGVEDLLDALFGRFCLGK